VLKSIKSDRTLDYVYDSTDQTVRMECHHRLLIWLSDSVKVFFIDFDPNDKYLMDVIYYIQEHIVSSPIQYWEVVKPTHNSVLNAAFGWYHGRTAGKV